MFNPSLLLKYTITMKARVLLVLALLVISAFAHEGHDHEHDHDQAADKKAEEEPKIEDAEKEVEDKDKTYFTQETLKELSRVDEFKNNRLWACHLLASCKLKAEQVILKFSIRCRQPSQVL